MLVCAIVNLLAEDHPAREGSPRADSTRVYSLLSVLSKEFLLSYGWRDDARGNTGRFSKDSYNSDDDFALGFYILAPYKGLRGFYLFSGRPSYNYGNLLFVVEFVSSVNISGELCAYNWRGKSYNIVGLFDESYHMGTIQCALI